MQVAEHPLGSPQNSFPQTAYSQAPCCVHSLHPFEWSTIFFLFQDKQNIRPRIVTVKATTVSGIVVSKNIRVEYAQIEPSTIHQLAAKAIMVDLETGQSWTHTAACDSDPSKSQEPVSELAIREEAERIGLKWSIMGNWTSFVAVGSNNEEIMAGFYRAPRSKQGPSGLPRLPVMGMPQIPPVNNPPPGMPRSRSRHRESQLRPPPNSPPPPPGPPGPPPNFPRPPPGPPPPPPNSSNGVLGWMAGKRRKQGNSDESDDSSVDVRVGSRGGKQPRRYDRGTVYLDLVLGFLLFIILEIAAPSTLICLAFLYLLYWRWQTGLFELFQPSTISNHESSISTTSGSSSSRSLADD
jgi:hypothetical protein